ncbi:MAG: response regulator, partial [Gemmatimonadota bacterium]
MAHILLVEDNDDLAFGLRATLEFEGHDVEVAPDGGAARRTLEDGTPDLLVLDLTLPDVDGLTLLAELRTRGDRTPVLILTARGDEADVLMGFDRGADDYVTKP